MVEPAAGRPTFLLSFDCEGKWGLADHLTPALERQLSNRALNQSYRRLLRLLESYALPATFAFVAGFTLSPEEYAAHQELFPPLLYHGRVWLGAFYAALARGDHDGWLNPEALELVRQAPQHEIASHSHSHIPVSGLEQATFRQELRRLRQIGRLKGLNWQSFVYPRNEIAYPQELAAAGFLGYRGRPAYAGSRLRSAAQELNLWATGEQPGAGRPVVLPAGHFLNWRAGGRRLIPPQLTLWRWRRLLETAARQDGVVHLWCHPHNFVTVPGQYALLEQILRLVAQARDRGELAVATQQELALKAGAAD